MVEHVSFNDGILLFLVALTNSVIKVHFHFIPKPNGNEGLGISWPGKDASKSDLQLLVDEIKNKVNSKKL